MPDDIDRETVEIDAAEEPILRDIAQSLGLSIEPIGSRTLDPTLLLFLVGAPAMIALALERFRDRRRGGQVIDLRPGAPSVVYRDRGVVFGLVVVFTADGEVRVEVKETADHLAEITQQVVKVVTTAAAKELDAIADAVRSSTGTATNVTVHPTDHQAEHQPELPGGPPDADPPGQS